jgi:DNA modification methylase
MCWPTISSLNAGWDTEILAIELQALIDIEFDVTLTGFSHAEIDLTLDHAQAASGAVENTAADLIPTCRRRQCRNSVTSGCSDIIACCAAMPNPKTT